MMTLGVLPAGGLGKISTHAVAYARLIIGGEDHGVHGNCQI